MIKGDSYLYSRQGQGSPVTAPGSAQLTLAIDYPRSCQNVKRDGGRERQRQWPERERRTDGKEGSGDADSGLTGLLFRDSHVESS